MKSILVPFTCSILSLLPAYVTAQSGKADSSVHRTDGKNLYLDVHQLTLGKVKFEDVAAAHAKDLATEKKNGVHFIKYWVNEEKGLVYCLSSSSDEASITKTHKEAHGLLPDKIYAVTDGTAAALTNSENFFLDVHYLGAGKVTAADVEAAHQKDLATQQKYGVNFVNYWVDEKLGTVVCLSEAPDSLAVIKTHTEAHGLVPSKVERVQQGQ